MQRLILLRHGKTESVAASGGDFERRLTERGRRDAALIGRVLAEAGITPDLAMVSAARRAQETWKEASPAFPHARCENSRRLYLASSEQLAQTVATATEPVNCLIIVGHNPGLHEYAVSLYDAAPPNPMRDGFPTASAAVFRLAPSGAATFERFLLPREHGGGAD